MGTYDGHPGATDVNIRAEKLWKIVSFAPRAPVKSATLFNALSSDASLPALAVNAPRKIAG